MADDIDTILVTGAAGFVGQHLARVLASSGWRVRGATRQVRAKPERGVDEWAVIERIGPDTDWSAALRGVKAIVHLAALAHRTDPKNQPAEGEFMRVNAQGTRRL